MGGPDGKSVLVTLKAGSVFGEIRSEWGETRVLGKGWGRGVISRGDHVPRGPLVGLRKPRCWLHWHLLACERGGLIPTRV